MIFGVGWGGVGGRSRRVHMLLCVRVKENGGNPEPRSA